MSRHSSDLRGQGRDLSFLENAVVAGVRVRVRFDTYPTPNLKTAFFELKKIDSDPEFLLPPLLMCVKLVSTRHAL